MKSLKTQNYYDVLGVTQNATPEEIRSAYEISRHTFQENSLATYSLFSDQENQEILALIAKAFETLFNPESRRAYDAGLSEQVGGTPPPPRRVPGAASHGVPNLEPANAGAQPTGAVYSSASQAARPRMEPESMRRPGPMGMSPTSSQSMGEPARSAGAGMQRSMPQASASAAGAAQQTSSPNPAMSAAGLQSAAPKPAPVSEKPPPNPAREEFLKTVTKFDGQVLKKLRLMNGLSLEEMAEKSKIRRAYLEYIEEENFQFLPASVYVKGFVTLMANILGAPPQRAAEDYMTVARAKKHGN
jgi:hypothetical protein